MDERYNTFFAGIFPALFYFAEPAVTSVDQLKEAAFAVLTGTTSGPDAEAFFPDARIEYFNTITDMLAVLRAGKADAMVMDKGSLRYMQIDNKDVTAIGDVLTEISLAPAFPKTDKGQALCNEYNEFVKKLREDGTMEKLDSIWFGDDESAREVLDYENLPGENGTLTLAVDASITPFSYMKDRKIVGYDVDIAARFCEANGYRLKVSDMSFDGTLAAVQTSKCDFASCGITVTVIYFLLEEIISFAVRRISVNVDPKRRRHKKLLEGVNRDD